VIQSVCNETTLVGEAWGGQGGASLGRCLSKYLKKGENKEKHVLEHGRASVAAAVQREVRLHRILSTIVRMVIFATF
jgi:hypothetical protein